MAAWCPAELSEVQAQEPLGQESRLSLSPRAVEASEGAFTEAEGVPGGSACLVAPLKSSSQWPWG